MNNFILQTDMFLPQQINVFDKAEGYQRGTIEQRADGFYATPFSHPETIFNSLQADAKFIIQAKPLKRKEVKIYEIINQTNLF